MKIKSVVLLHQNGIFFTFESHDNYLKFNRESLGMSLFYEKNLEGGKKRTFAPQKLLKQKC